MTRSGDQRIHAFVMIAKDYLFASKMLFLWRKNNFNIHAVFSLIVY